LHGHGHFATPDDTVEFFCDGAFYERYDEKNTGNEEDQRDNIALFKNGEEQWTLKQKKPATPLR
jgi:hypothetical protein